MAIWIFTLRPPTTVLPLAPARHVRQKIFETLLCVVDSRGAEHSVDAVRAVAPQRDLAVEGKAVANALEHVGQQAAGGRRFGTVSRHCLW